MTPRRGKCVANEIKVEKIFLKKEESEKLFIFTHA
ncbi:hypothetical protein EDC54_103313 [Samsonia erythrinae]|uniref:Uncharacterized protein n=1 Tax=Samsonia erythrinae TaxID=160434 RepID=A0A4R3VQR7_9GAMM|nr:hypothetical protein EDC54_103313 [Samsonia erythrinae]